MRKACMAGISVLIGISMLAGCVKISGCGYGYGVCTEKRNRAFGGC